VRIKNKIVSNSYNLLLCYLGSGVCMFVATNAGKRGLK